MKDTKRRMEMFSFYDHTGMEKHLEKMARKGWLLEKIDPFGWTYRRVEPKEVRFAVSFYPKASMYDPEPSEDQKTFQDFCRHTGWIPVEATGPMQIFYNEGKDPTPIGTDPEMEVENLHKAVKKSYLASYWMLLVLGLVELAFLFLSYHDSPIGFLSSAPNLVAVSSFLLLLLTGGAELGTYYSWRRRARRAAEEGVFLPSRGTSGLQKVCLALVTVVFLTWMLETMTTAPLLLRVTTGAMVVYVAVLMLAVNGVTALLKKKKVSAKWNKIATWGTSFFLSFLMVGLIVFGVLRADRAGLFDQNRETYAYKGQSFTAYTDDLPLTVDDLRGGGDEGYSFHKTVNSSVLLRVETMRQNVRMDALGENLFNLDYVLYSPKAFGVYEICKKELLFRDDGMDPENMPAHYAAVDPEPWKAVSAYELCLPEKFQGSRNWLYLLCYEDRLLSVSFDWEPTREQMAIVGEILG